MLKLGVTFCLMMFMASCLASCASLDSTDETTQDHWSYFEKVKNQEIYGLDVPSHQQPVAPIKTSSCSSKKQAVRSSKKCWYKPWQWFHKNKKNSPTVCREDANVPVKSEAMKAQGQQSGDRSTDNVLSVFQNKEDAQEFQQQRRRALLSPYRNDRSVSITKD